eukprot:CAMPEP_0184307820 /NCGR_PEP_ID=MMETSP1049-20130417/16456_1 /TAXON_ID=77928 /ORGANISM="Proteomonas sulcata, Strain CCMP704" /LENGTH=51 /DNA_ID=CAMNT_0026620391 /DNA_START=189 /DNA_END=344 /DNA_ORIENTATION=-
MLNALSNLQSQSPCPREPPEAWHQHLEAERGPSTWKHPFPGGAAAAGWEGG